MILLASAIGGVSRFVATANQGLKDHELSARIVWELSNLREAVGCWSPETITKTRIERIPVAEGITSKLESARWKAQIEEIEQPVNAIQVHIALHCTYYGQSAVPDELTFWIPIDRKTEVSDPVETPERKVKKGQPNE